MTQFKGDWYARPLQRGHNRRPHFFVGDNHMSICGNSGRGGYTMLFDIETGQTLEDDPSIGEPQTRQECRVCADIVNLVPYTRARLEEIASSADSEHTPASRLHHIYTRELRGGGHVAYSDNENILIRAILDLQERRGMTPQEGEQ